MEDTTQITTTNQSFNIEALISQAISKKASVSALKEMLAMRKELKAEWAKEEFNKSMAGFQSECPVIAKTKGVKTKSGQVAYKYAPIEVLDSDTKKLREKFGFSYKTDQITFMDNNDRQIKAIVTVTHKAGHSEKTEMTVPLGNKTEIMSNSQVTAAAYTFAKRYAFKNAFGIVEADEDNEALLKRGDDEAKKDRKSLPEEDVKKIESAKDEQELINFCKEIKTARGEEYQEELVELYTKRKDDIQNANI